MDVVKAVMDGGSVKEHIAMVTKRVKSLPRHPESPQGWWCCAESDMRELLIILSCPKSRAAMKFRSAVATQISCCRKCAYRYHMSVHQWMESRVKAFGLKETMQLVLNLHDWDVDRIRPVFHKLTLAGESELVACRLLCREAFFEILACPRLAFHDEIARALSVYFKNTGFVSGKDVAEHLKSIQASEGNTISCMEALPGLQALLFHELSDVRAWTEKIVRHTTGILDEAPRHIDFVLKTIFDAIRRHQEKGKEPRFGGKDNILERFLEGLCRYLSVCSDKMIRRTFRGNQDVWRILYGSLTSSCLNVVKNVASTLVRVMPISGQEIFAGACSGVQSGLEAFLDLLKSAIDQAEDGELKNMLLSLMLAVFRNLPQMHKEAIADISESIFYFLVKRSKKRRSAAACHRGKIFVADLTKQVSNSMDQTFREYAAHVLLQAYRLSTPLCPFARTDVLAEFALDLIKDSNLKEISPAVLATVLLTDARNVLREFTDQGTAEKVFMKLSGHPLKCLSDVCQDSFIYQSNRKADVERNTNIAWSGQLWGKFGRTSFREGIFSNADNLCSIVGVDAFLEVHRAIGMISRSPHLRNKKPEESLSFFCAEEGAVVAINGPKECLDIMMNAVDAVLLKESNSSRPQCLERLPFHASHLLSSSQKRIRSSTIDLLEKLAKSKQEKRQNDRFFQIFSKLQKVRRLASSLVEGSLVTSSIIGCFNLNQISSSVLAVLMVYRTILRAHCGDAVENTTAPRQSLYYVLMQVLNEWRYLHGEDPGICTEIIMRFFKLLPFLWEFACGWQPESVKTNLLFNPRTSLLKALAEMGKDLDRNILKAWASVLMRVSNENTKIPSIRSTLIETIDMAVESNTGLDPDTCEDLVKLFSLGDAQLQIVRQWRKSITRTGGVLRPVTNSLDSAIDSLQSQSLPRPASFPAKTTMELLRLKLLKEQERKREEARNKIATNNIQNPSRYREMAERAVAQARTAPLHRKIVGQSSSALPLEMEKAACLSAAQKHVRLRSKEDLFKVVLSWHLPLAERCGSNILSSEGHGTFDTAEAYVQHWQGILIEEIRASLAQALEEEETSSKTVEMQHEAKCRVSCQVTSPAERINSLHRLVVSLDDRRVRSRTQQNGENKSFRLDLQVADVVRIDMAPPPNTKANSSSILMIGIVEGIEKRGQSFSLSVSFEGKAQAPGIGRRLKVSRVMSLVPQGRLLAALWTINLLPDNLLWTVLDPEKGWKNLHSAQDLIKNGSELSKPVSALLARNVLNQAQAESVNAVAMACGNVLRDSSMHKTGRPSESVTLIQGPPGTGKTTTILSMLGVLLANRDGVVRGRYRERVIVGVGKVTIAPFRILVCAPSNAAVDEILLRVMTKGIPMPNGQYSCPRVVRIGSGATIDAVNEVHINTLAQGSNSCTSSPNGLSSIRAEIDNLYIQKQHVSDQIDGILERRTNLRSAIEKSNDQREREKLRRKDKDLSNLLSELHDRKSTVVDAISTAKKRHELEGSRLEIATNLAYANVLNSASIVFCTLNSSAHDLMRHLVGSFNTVIVDEAAQCIEPEILIPIVGNAALRVFDGKGSSANTTRSACVARHCVLVGDPKQLPATVLSTDRKVVRACGKSLFERLGDSEAGKVHLLNVQYRMHPDVCRFPSTAFYNSKLICGSNVQSSNYHKAFHFDDRKRFGPVTFLDTSTCTHAFEERMNGKSVVNKFESNLIVSSLVALFRRYPFEDLIGQIAVLTPYSGQVAQIRQSISRHQALKDARIDVSTVDGIQGREKSIVFLSTVRGGLGHGIGFVKDPRRMNVALTRAKHSIIIVGNSTRLRSSSKEWDFLFSDCNRNGSVIRAQDFPEQLFPECVSDTVKPAPTVDSYAVLPDLSRKTGNPSAYSDREAPDSEARFVMSPDESRKPAYAKSEEIPLPTPHGVQSVLESSTKQLDRNEKVTGGVQGQLPKRPSRREGFTAENTFSGRLSSQQVNRDVDTIPSKAEVVLDPPSRKRKRYSPSQHDVDDSPRKRRFYSDIPGSKIPDTSKNSAQTKRNSWETPLKSDGTASRNGKDRARSSTFNKGISYRREKRAHSPCADSKSYFSSNQNDGIDSSSFRTHSMAMDRPSKRPRYSPTNGPEILSIDRKRSPVSRLPHSGLGPNTGFMSNLRDAKIAPYVQPNSSFHRSTSRESPHSLNEQNRTKAISASQGKKLQSLNLLHNRGLGRSTQVGSSSARWRCNPSGEKQSVHLLSHSKERFSGSEMGLISASRDTGLKAKQVEGNRNDAYQSSMQREASYDVKESSHQQRLSSRNHIALGCTPVPQPGRPSAACSRNERILTTSHFLRSSRSNPAPEAQSAPGAPQRGRPKPFSLLDLAKSMEATATTLKKT